MGKLGWDRHVWEIPADMKSDSTKVYLVVKALFVLTSSSIRMSLLAFYLWLIKGAGRSTLTTIIYVCMGANAVLCIACCVADFLRCSPVSAAWTSPMPAGAKCINDGVTTMVAGSFLCLADLIVNALPILIVAKLKIPGRQRITIGILLCIGSLATLAGIVREVWIYKTLLATNDWTWEALPLWICAEAEIYIALVSSSAHVRQP
ncbi:hypothetical protein M8818_005028 [Zalaria obscura]|uniref:Uncharacterized protein n=1 Tax=Zalaria obscura TaxID=2024903 RepID=A0ACC3S9W8_9PEZI